MGYRDARVTRGGADGGIDVIGSRVVAQVKWHTRPVGSPDLQRLVGAAGTSRQLVFVSRAGFSAPALAYAARVDMALLTLDHRACARAANPIAHRLLTTGRKR